MGKLGKLNLSSFSRPRDRAIGSSKVDPDARCDHVSPRDFRVSLGISWIEEGNLLRGLSSLRTCPYFPIGVSRQLASRLDMRSAWGGANMKDKAENTL